MVYCGKDLGQSRRSARARNACGCSPGCSPSRRADDVHSECKLSSRQKHRKPGQGNDEREGRGMLALCIESAAASTQSGWKYEQSAYQIRLPHHHLAYKRQKTHTPPVAVLVLSSPPRPLPIFQVSLLSAIHSALYNADTCSVIITDISVHIRNLRPSCQVHFHSICRLKFLATSILCFHKDIRGSSTTELEYLQSAAWFAVPGAVFVGTSS